MTAKRTKDNGNGNGERQRETAAEFRGYVRAALGAVDTRLGEIQGALGAMDERLRAVEVAVGQLKVKAGIWGALGGVLGAAVVSAGFLVSLLLLFWKGWLT